MARAKAYLQRISGFSHNARMFLIATTLMYFGWSGTGVLFPLYFPQLGYDAAFLGRVYAVMGLATAVFALPAGWLLSRGRQKPVMLAACILQAAAGLVEVAIPERSIMLFASAAIGAMSGLFAVVQSPFISKNSSGEERAQLFSVTAAAMTVVAVVGGYFAGIAPQLASVLTHSAAESAQSYRLALSVLAVLPALACIPIMAVDETSHGASQTAAAQDSRPAERKLDRRAMIFLAAGCLLLGASSGFIIPYSNLLLKLKAGLSTPAIGTLNAVQNVLITMAILAYPAAEKSLGRVGLISAGHMMCVPFALLMGLAASPLIIVVGFFGRGIIANMVYPAREKFAMEISPHRDREMVSSVQQTCWQFAWALATWGAGYLITARGYGAAFLAGSACYALSAAAYWVGFRHLDKKEVEHRAG
jgi:MFS family permease